MGVPWLVVILSLFLMLGESGCLSHHPKVVSHWTYVIPENSFPQGNIGLIEIPHQIQSKILLQDSQQLTESKGIFLRTFQGAWEGAVMGYEAGLEFCGSLEKVLKEVKTGDPQGNDVTSSAMALIF